MSETVTSVRRPKSTRFETKMLASAASFSGRIGIPDMKLRSFGATRTSCVGSTPQVETTSMDAFLLHIQKASSRREPIEAEGVDSRNVKFLKVVIASSMKGLTCSRRIFDRPLASLCVFSLSSCNSQDQAIRQTIPAARSISMFQVLTYLAFRSMDSLSTVGMTDGAEICALSPVV